MRHLRVPSQKTAEWLDNLRSKKWLQERAGVTKIDENFRAIPLSDTAPDIDEAYGENIIVELEPKLAGPKSWQERIEPEILEKIGKRLPNSYEIQGDVLIVKLESEVQEFSREIGNAFLQQLSSVRIVCRDDGVQGQFRVRKLVPIASRNDEIETKTIVREHGIDYATDPAKAYFSSRLATERLESAHHCLRLHSELGRKLTIYDPYAGVGPNLGLPISDKVAAHIIAGDLNPDATSLLEENLSSLSKKYGEFTFETYCKNALSWKEESMLQNKADVLFVNIPHSSIQHLPEILPLMKKNSLSLIRGWMIIEREEMPEIKSTIQATCEKFGAEITSLEVQEVKGFSTTKCFARLTIFANFLD